MIPTLLALLVGQAPQTSTALMKASAAEVTRIRAFVRLVNVDRNGAPFSKAALNAEPVRVPRGDWLGRPGYHVGEETGVSLSPVTGYIVGYGAVVDHSIDRPSRPRTDEKGRPGLYSVPRRVTDEEAAAFVARMFTATGQPYGAWVYAGVQDGAGGNGDNLAINFVPTYRGVPYEDDYLCYVEIDRETGQLERFDQRREPPAPPASVVPHGSADDAHLIALRAAARAGVAVRDYPNSHPVLEITGLDPKHDKVTTYNYTPNDRADAFAERGRLVYDVRLAGVLAPAMYIVLVDAQDGRLLQVRREPTNTFSSPGKDAAKPSAPFAPPSEARSWRVAEDDAPWGKPVDSTLTPATVEGFAPVRKFLMTDGRVAFTAEYDPKADAVGVTGADGKVATYRLGPALADALKAKP